ncbi:MAG: hypothetical protein P1P84_02830 [Deferrisomatales bacterium]|nr:hypothetical protein [Deferrisomatales bacterium]
MPTVEVDIQVWCGTCGEGLCNQAENDRRGGVSVEACPKCLEAEYDRGYAARDNEE